MTEYVSPEIERVLERFSKTDLVEIVCLFAEEFVGDDFDAPELLAEIKKRHEKLVAEGHQTRKSLEL